MNNFNNKGRQAEPTFQDYLDIIYRHRLLIVIIFLATLLSSFYFSFRSPKLYESDVTFRLALKRTKPTIFSDFTPVSYYYINLIESEIEVIKSKTIAKTVVKKLGLNFTSVEINRFQTFDSIVLASNVAPGKYQIVLQPDSFYLIDKHNNNLGAGSYGVRANFAGGISFILENPKGKYKQAGAIINIVIEDVLASTEALRQSIKVMQIKNTDLISLKAQSQDPILAALISNSMANAYIDYSLLSLREEARISKDFIEDQIKKFGHELAQAEENLKKYKERSGIFLLDESAREMTDALAHFDATKAQTQVEIEEVKSRLTNLEEELRSDENVFGQYKAIASFPTITSSPLVTSLQEKLKNLELQKQKTTEATEIAKIDTEIKKVNQAIQAAINQILKAGPPSSDPILQSIIFKVIENESQLIALQSRLAALNQVISEFNAKLSRLPKAEVELAQLSREKSANEEIYTMLLSKLEETKISEAREVGEAKIIDYAVPPLSPISPKKKQNAILGAILGMILGIGAAFVIEYLDTSIRDPKDIEFLTDLPVLASIPVIKIQKNLSDNEISKIEARFITHFNPRSSISEAYRILRTNLTFSAVKEPVKSIVVTSSLPQEGKSTIVGNLAITFAQMGNRSIIIDTDLRKPVFNKIFKGQSLKGLSDVLVGHVRLNDAIFKTNIENLHLLPSGALPPNPTELLSSIKMKDLHQELKGAYEYLFFDSPPALGVADPTIIGNLCDGLLFVVYSGKTNRDMVLEAIKNLQNAHIRILGTVINGVEVTHRYRSRYYYYQRYYEETEVKD